MNADDILQPPTVEEIVLRLQKMLAAFECAYPGIIQKTREWVQTEEFFLMFHCRLSTPSVPLFAPISMKVHMLGFLNKVKIGADIHDAFEGMALLLWKEIKVKYQERLL